MQTTFSEEFFNNEIAFLVLQIGKLNDIISNNTNHNDKLGVWQYTRHRQQFIDQLNNLLTQYKLQVSVTA